MPNLPTDLTTNQSKNDSVGVADILQLKGITSLGPRTRSEPLWKGPEDSGEQGGITQSMLSRFIACRERFRLHAIEGLRSADGFNHRMEYGSMWHACEEEFARTKGTHDNWARALKEYCSKLANQYRPQVEQVQHWYEVCRIQFPIYAKFWAEHPDVKDRVPMFQEQMFNLPYTLPSGRVVYLRGKMDSVDLIGKGVGSGVYLQENKVKGDINERDLVRQLRFDLQTMLYLVALYRLRDSIEDKKLRRYLGTIRGVRYNVIRRPLSGGKGSIVQHKGTKNKPAETKREYYQRLSGIIEASPRDFFYRWKVEVTPGEVAEFERRCLIPILEQLCDWYGWVSNPKRREHGPFASSGGHVNRLHWQHPFGIYNPMDEGYSSDVDEYIETGSEVGLRRIDDLFPELR